MSDNTTVHIGENSPEQVAFKLLGIIANVEGRDFYSHGSNPADREYLLKTYAQCLQTVKFPSKVDSIVSSYSGE